MTSTTAAYLNLLLFPLAYRRSALNHHAAWQQVSPALCAAFLRETMVMMMQAGRSALEIRASVLLRPSVTGAAGCSGWGWGACKSFIACCSSGSRTERGALRHREKQKVDLSSLCFLLAKRRNFFLVGTTDPNTWRRGRVFFQYFTRWAITSLTSLVLNWIVGCSYPAAQLDNQNFLL